MKCATCRIEEAVIHPQYGAIACSDCQKYDKIITDRTYEFLPKHIKEERLAFKDQTIQPFRNGQLSKEYIDLYGTSRIEVSDEEVKNAKNVWDRSLPGDFYKR